MIDKIAIALDCSSEADIRNILLQLDPKPQVLKIGLEVISSLGVEKALGFITEHAPESQIFLDFKLHDIPNTVAASVRALRKRFGSKLKYLTVHASGGSQMLEAALSEAQDSVNIVAVTVLTSLSEESLKSDFSLGLPARDLVLNLATLAYKSGVRYFVSSPHECAFIKKQLAQAKVITPGIRLQKLYKDDQSRSCTPLEALNNGSDLLVIGRPVTASPSPSAAWKSIVESID